MCKKKKCFGKNIFDFIITDDVSMLHSCILTLIQRGNATDVQEEAG